LDHPGSSDIKSTKCEDCKVKVATFGLIEKKHEKARWCGVCAKKHGGVNIKSKKCEDCSAKTASFGLPNEGSRRWCGDCAGKHDDAQNMNRKKCEGCQVHYSRRTSARCHAVVFASDLVQRWSPPRNHRHRTPSPQWLEAEQVELTSFPPVVAR
jgi:hypothetical protein